MENGAEDKNQSLLRKFLMLENPVITEKMISFLALPEVCLEMSKFVTRVEGDDQVDKVDCSVLPICAVRNVVERDCTQSSEMIRSYRVTSLFDGEAPSEMWIQYMLKVCPILTEQVFRIFQKNARGHLYHGCVILDRLLNHHADEVYQVIGDCKQRVALYFSNMLQHIAQPCVADFFLTLICKPHTIHAVSSYITSPSIKWKFFRSLSEWQLLTVLSTHITDDKYDEQHAVAAQDIFSELLKRLAADENGEILLQPAAHNPQLLNGLINKALDKKASLPRSTAAMQCVLEILEMSLLSQVPGPPLSPYQSFGATTTNFVPNQLASLQSPIFACIQKRVPELLQHLLHQYGEQQNIEMSNSLADGQESHKPLPPSAVRHTSYVVKVPFSEFRLCLVQILVQIAKMSTKVFTTQFTTPVWRALLRWFFEYPHNNLYHAAFYELVVLALTSKDETMHQVLFKKLKLVTVLIEYYEKNGPRTSNRGYILQLCNAIRLYGQTVSTDDFVNRFLQSHVTWRNFQDELHSTTLSSLVPGLGFNVPSQARFGEPCTPNRWLGYGDEMIENIDIGSPFADSLGFQQAIRWENPCTDTTPKSNRKKKKKKKKNNNATSPNHLSESEQ